MRGITEREEPNRQGALETEVDHIINCAKAVSYNPILHLSVIVVALSVTFTALNAQPKADRVAAVVDTSGLIAFWDFVKREDGERGRFTAHQPSGSTHDFALDAANYVRNYWGTGREATYADFPLLGRGLFGEAIRIRQEGDPDFRPLLLIPRARLHDTPLDIKGSDKALTLVVWAIRESGSHALAGIWHEGTDLKEKETVDILKAVRGQRQYGIFAGLNKRGAACAHISDNGAGSFEFKYALHRGTSEDVSPAVPSNAPLEILDQSWQCFAMTFDSRTEVVTGWLNGKSSPRWATDLNNEKSLKSVYNAWRQGYLRGIPGKQEGENPSYPADQFYNPPEHKAVWTKVQMEDATTRTEIREYGYTRVQVSLEKASDGDWKEVSRDLVAVRLNPWWFPHDIYTPRDDGTGGPFTIGRVIHSGKGVGFTGWIGGVAVFDRALSGKELAAFSDLSK